MSRLGGGGGGADLSDADTLTRCDAFLAQNYSRELHNLAMTLIRSTPRPPSILDISRAIAVRSLEEHDAAYRAVDRTEAALSAEYESGRALRLLLKLSFMTERPELGGGGGGGRRRRTSTTTTIIITTTRTGRV